MKVVVGIRMEYGVQVWLIRMLSRYGHVPLWEGYMG